MATDIAVTLPKLSAAAETGFSVTALRGFVEGGFGGLSDGTLQTLLDAAMTAIVNEIGPPGETDELITVHGDLLMLSRRAASITSIVERHGWIPVTIAADDYEVSRSGRLLTRLRTGTNPSWCWRGRVKPTYVPVDDTAERIRVAVGLVKLDIVHNPGLPAITIGTWTEQYTSNSAFNYEVERAAILASLTSGEAGIR